MKDQALKDKFVELRATGKSYAAIAQELGICKQTAINWTRELNEQIINIKAIELDALYGKHSIGAKTRIELLGGQLEKIKEEMQKRNLGDVTTPKLLEMFFKISDTMQSEQIALQFRETTQKSLLDVDFEETVTTTYALN